MAVVGDYFIAEKWKPGLLAARGKVVNKGSN
jgi:hypothetical protein